MQKAFLSTWYQMDLWHMQKNNVCVAKCQKWRRTHNNGGSEQNKKIKNDKVIGD
jgi:hypothetical protein